MVLKYFAIEEDVFRFKHDDELEDLKISRFVAKVLSARYRRPRAPIIDRDNSLMCVLSRFSRDAQAINPSSQVYVFECLCELFIKFSPRIVLIFDSPRQKLLSSTRRRSSTAGIRSIPGLEFYFVRYPPDPVRPAEGGSCQIARRNRTKIIPRFATR